MKIKYVIDNIFALLTGNTHQKATKRFETLNHSHTGK